jgi:hypothetical protein
VKAWLSLTEAAEHVGVSVDLVRERMRDTATAGVDVAWVNAGTENRALYRFNASQIDTWWQEIHRWRERQSAGTKLDKSGSSAGVTPTARSTRTTASGRKTRTRSQPTSTTPSRSSAAGRLIDLTSKLTSRPA